MSEPLNPDGTVATDATEVPAETPPESQGEQNRTLLIAAAAVLGALLLGGGLFWLFSNLGSSGEPSGGQTTAVIPTGVVPTSELTGSPSGATSPALPTATVGGRDPFAPIYVTTVPTTAAPTTVAPTTVAPTTAQPTYPTYVPPTYPTYVPPTYPTYVPPTTSFPTYPTTTPTSTSGTPTASPTGTGTGGPTPTGSGTSTGTAVPTLPPASQYTVQLVGLDEAQVADITINETSFSASPGDVMGPFKYQNVTSSTCISMLFGDVTFPICVGEAVVLNA